jgi:hypothetical protein
MDILKFNYTKTQFNLKKADHIQLIWGNSILYYKIGALHRFVEFNFKANNFKPVVNWETLRFEPSKEQFMRDMNYEFWD